MSAPNGAAASNVIETLVAHFFYHKEIPVLRVQTSVTSLVLLAILALTGQAVAQSQLPADLTDKIDKVIFVLATEDIFAVYENLLKRGGHA